MDPTNALSEFTQNFPARFHKKKDARPVGWRSNKASFGRFFFGANHLKSRLQCMLKYRYIERTARKPEIENDIQDANRWTATARAVD